MIDAATIEIAAKAVRHRRAKALLAALNRAGHDDSEQARILAILAQAAAIRAQLHRRSATLPEIPVLDEAKEIERKLKKDS
jgi:hypothetical protein